MKLVSMIWSRKFPEIYLGAQCTTFLFRGTFPFKDQIHLMKGLNYNLQILCVRQISILLEVF